MNASPYLLSAVIFVTSFSVSIAEPSVPEEGERAPKKQAAAEKKIPTEITLVALGPKPTRKYKHTEGSDAPIMLLAKPGETPPSRLYYKGKSSTDKKTSWKSFNVSFNNPSAMRPITPGKSLVLYLKKPKDEGYEKYATIPAAKLGSRRIIFLTPAQKGPKPWAVSPKLRIINLDAETFQGKQFILKNLSKFTIMHAFEDSVTSVLPMKTISYKRAKTGQLYRLAAQYGTHKKIIYNTAVRLSGEGHIHLYALYDANPKTNNGRSVGVFRTMVPARKLPEVSPESESTP